jgi:hypothetical protein
MSEPGIQQQILNDIARNVAENIVRFEMEALQMLTRSDSTLRARGISFTGDLSQQLHDAIQTEYKKLKRDDGGSI